jgi:hypothetical protein
MEKRVYHKMEGLCAGLAEIKSSRAKLYQMDSDDTNRLVNHMPD